MVVLLFILIVLGLFFDYKHTLILYAVFKIAILKSFLLVGSVNLNTAVSIVAFVIFITTIHNNSNDRLLKFPLKTSFFVFTLFSLFNVCMNQVHITDIMATIFETIVFSVLFFETLITTNDVYFFNKCLFVFSLIIVGNAFVELFTGQNYIAGFIQENSNVNTYFADDSIVQHRGIRIRSAFPHSIVFGTICLVISFYFLFLLLEHKFSILYSVIIVLLFSCIILSNSRTPIFAMPIFFIPFLTLINDRRKSIFVIFVLLMIAFFCKSYIYDIYMSLFSETKQDDFGGSSLDLRLFQLSGVWNLIQDNIWFGVGAGGINFERYWDSILGAESIWLTVLLYKGIIGVVVYIYLYFDIYKQFKDHYYHTYIIFFILGWVVANTISNMSGMDNYVLFLFVIVIACSSRIKEKKMY